MISQDNQHSHLEAAEARFAEIRHLVYRQVESDVWDAIKVDIRLTSISEATAAIGDGWIYPQNLQERVPGWSWAKEARKFRRKPKRIEAAFWAPSEDGSGIEILCALVLGRVSRGRVVASIHFLGSNPEVVTTISGKVAQIAVRYLELHATALGCSKLSIANPIPDLIQFYGAFGFKKQVTKGRRVIRLERALDLSDDV